MSEATLALDWWLSVVVTSARVGRLVDWSVWERSGRWDRQRGLCLTDLSKNCHLAFCQTAVLLPAHQKSHQHFSVEKPCCPDSYIGQLVTHSITDLLQDRLQILDCLVSISREAMMKIGLRKADLSSYPGSELGFVETKLMNARSLNSS